ARRERDDAFSPFVLREPRQRVVGAAELEGAAALQVLAFEEHLRACSRIDGSRRDDRRAVRHARDLMRSGVDVGVGWQSECRHGYFNFPSSSSYTLRIAIGPCEDASVHDAYSPKFASLMASSTGMPDVCKRVASAMTASSAR